MFPDFFVSSAQQKNLLRAQTLLMVSCKYLDTQNICFVAYCKSTVMDMQF